MKIESRQLGFARQLSPRARLGQAVSGTKQPLLAKGMLEFHEIPQEVYLFAAKNKRYFEKIADVAYARDFVGDVGDLGRFSVQFPTHLG